MKRIYVTSIDDVLYWLGVEFTTRLPDPQIIDDQFYDVPIQESPAVSVYRDYSEFPVSTTFKRRTFVKREIIFDGRKLTVWSDA